MQRALARNGEQEGDGVSSENEREHPWIGAARETHAHDAAVRLERHIAHVLVPEQEVAARRFDVCVAASNAQDELRDDTADGRIGGSRERLASADLDVRFGGPTRSGGERDLRAHPQPV